MVQKLKALIVDDEESARKLLAKLLEETQYFNEMRMAKSVQSKKFLKPISVAPNKDGYEITQGNRRYYAAKQARLKEIPCRIIKKHKNKLKQ